MGVIPTVGDYDYGYTTTQAQAIAADIPAAANLSDGTNPGYASTDFLASFPQFASVCTSPDGGETPPLVPAALLQQFINMATASLSQSKWFDLWQYAVGLFVAHYVTMFLAASQQTTPKGLVAGAKPASIMSSKSVGNVSASYDTSSIAEDMKGWGAYKTTTYGQQLITLSKTVGAGMGGMLVW